MQTEPVKRTRLAARLVDSRAALVVLQERDYLRLLGSRLRNAEVDAFENLIEGVLSAWKLADSRPERTLLVQNEIARRNRTGRPAAAPGQAELPVQAWRPRSHRNAIFRNSRGILRVALDSGH